ncbi:MAG: ankyrin repeat domain-containing protein [Parachlamydiaceae bacterium]
MTHVHACIPAFSFIGETAKDQKQYCALETLVTIDRLEKASKDSSIDSLRSKTITLQIKGKIKKIYESAVEKKQKLSMLWRRIFSKSMDVEDPCQNVTNSNSLFPLFANNPLPLPSDCIPYVLHYLECSDLANFALANKSAASFADLAFKERARELGYIGNFIQPAKNHLMVVAKDLDILAKGGPLTFRRCIVYNSKAQISIEKSIKSIQQLPIQFLISFLYPISAFNFYSSLLKDSSQADCIKKYNLSSCLKSAIFFNYPIKQTQMRIINSTLSLAVRLERTDLIRLLLSLGADPNATGHPLLYEVVVRPNQRENIKLLLSKATKQQIKEALLKAIALPYFENTIAFIEHGIDLNSTYGTSGRTALHYAAEYGYPETIHLFLKHGADVNQLDCYGNPPLVYAQNKRFKENIEALLNHSTTLA